MYLSIIIPVYNVNEYLKNTIENVLAQIYQDYELILVDDGSTDGSSEICDSFAEKDRRIRVIHQKNQGVSAARNTGVSSANGEYIGFVDSDDLIEPNMFEIMMSIAVAENADIVQCRHNRKPNILNLKYGNEKRIVDGKTFVRELFSYTGGEYTNQVALWSKVYKKELFRNIHFPDGRTYEDEQETYKLCLYATKIVLLPDELYHYVKRENSIITGIAPKKMIDKQLALEDRLQYLPARIPELEKECVESFWNYSKITLVDLFKNNEDKYIQIALDTVLRNRKTIRKYASKYDKVYLRMISIGILKKWILANDFSPIQNAISKIKR